MAQERSAFLREACGADSELRREVEQLLAAHVKAGGFLESPPISIPPHDSADGGGHPHHAAFEQPGAMVGPYRLIEQIGEGGMGTALS